MAAIPATARSTTTTFPAKAVADRLRNALIQLEADTTAIRDEWDPQFDSLAVVNIVCCIDEVIPGVPIAPEKIVRKGGYMSLDDAVRHILRGVEQAWVRMTRRSTDL